MRIVCKSSFLLLLLILSCQDNEFDRQLIVSTKTYGGEKVMNPTVTGEILDMGNAPITQHGFVWAETEDPDLTAPNVINLGARGSKGTFTSLLPDLFQNTTYYIRAYATNARGNTAYGKSITYKTPQQTTPLSATSGGSGTIIIIAGVFEFNTTAEINVFFGEFEATILLATSSIIQVIVPANIPPGEVKISIKITGKDPQFVPDNFTVLEAPVIESLAPARGAVGSTVTIRGKNFIETASFNTVFFDSIPAAVISASPTELVTKVPSGVEQGEVSVTVKSGGLHTALARKFSTQQEPVVTNYSPQTAPVGARITITGTNLGTDIVNTKVKFGEVEGTVAFVSDSLVSVNVPTGINVGANVPIKLTANGSTLTLTPNFVVKAEGTAAVTVATAINANTTWAKVAGAGEVDYRITADVNVTQELTVAPGVIIEFENGKSLTFSGATSALIAKGTAANPIVFTGKEKVKGSWRNIIFNGSNNSRNEFDFVEFSYGGGESGAMVDTYQYNSGGVTKFRITNSIFSHSKSAGFLIRDASTLDAFSNNTFHNNELSPLILPAREVGKLAASNRFTGNNGRNAVEVVSSTINAFTETVWNAFTDGSPYYIAGNITVNSGMKVMPGATLTFNLNTSLSISGAAAYLTANGTSTQPITFTGADRTFKGSWDKLYFANTLSPKNELDQVEISYGGSNASYPYNIQTDNSNVKITNSIISHSKSTGAHFNGGTLTLGFNTFANNNLYPVSIAVYQIRDMDSNSTYLNNGTNKINVYSSTLNDPGNEHVWKALGNDVPYLVSGDLTVRSGVSILPGAVFEFDEDAGIDVYEAAAYLIAKGTADQKIIFTGADQSVKGSWLDLSFGYTPSSKNELDYVEISYGSNSSVSVYNGSSLKISNSIISNSAGIGLTVSNNSTLTSCTNNQFIDNATYPISIPVWAIRSLDSNTSFLGNGNNVVYILDTDLNDPTTEHAWPALSNETAYLVNGNLNVNSGVSIQPGAVFTFAGLAGIQVGSSCCTANPSAYLIAKGTADKKIIFTSIDQTSEGGWGRITFYYTNSQKNELDFVDISYGSDATINIDDSNLKFTNSSISYSSGNGLNADDNSTLVSFGDNTFSNNKLYPLVISADQIGNLDSNSKFSDNIFNKVNIYGSTVDMPFIEQVWPAIADGTSYYVSGNILIRSGVSVQPGASFSFATSTGIQVGTSCCTPSMSPYLSAKGNPTNKIIFTGDDQSYNGSWDKITFYYTSSQKNELDYVDISYGSNATINIDDSNLKFTNSTISNSSGNGMYVDDNSSLLSFANNSFSNNSTYPLVLSVDQLGNLDSNSKFSGNTFNKVNIYSSTVDIPAFEQVWPAITDGTNYYISGDVVIRSGVSIQPGAIFSFAGNAGLQVGNSCCTPSITSYLIAKGTSSKPITFTRDVSELNNYWDGVSFYYTSNSINELDYVLISFGTNGISVNTSSAKITNSTITNSLNYGINRISSSSLNSDVKTSNTFTNNLLGDTNF